MRGLRVLLVTLLLASCAQGPSGDEAYCGAYSQFLRDMLSTDVDVSVALAQVPELEELARSAETEQLRQSASRLTQLIEEAERAGPITDDDVDQGTLGPILEETSTLNYLCGYTE